MRHVVRLLVMLVIIKELDVLAAASFVQTLQRVRELILNTVTPGNCRAHGFLGVAGSSRYTANLFSALLFLVHHS